MTDRNDDRERVRLALSRQKTLFFGVELRVAEGVLVPRPWTETLCRMAVDWLGKDGDTGAPAHPRTVLDLACGAGNLGCAIAASLPHARVLASDVHAASCELARENVRALGLEDRVTVLHGSLFEPLPGHAQHGSLDAIVCNPPYIPSTRLDGDGDRSHLLSREPREAFDGGPYGVSLLKEVVTGAVTWLKPGGALFLECGIGQERHVLRLLDRNGRFGVLAVERDPVGHACAIAAHLDALPATPPSPPVEPA